MKNYNPNKAVSANSYGINVLYTDTHKSHSLYYDEESPLRSIQIRGSRNTKDFSYQPEVAELINNQFKLLYNEAMYGLKTHTEEEIKAMTFVHRMSILDRFEQAQFNLNIWKQELIHSKLGSFLTTAFPKSEFAKGLANYPKSINPFDLCTITFKQLGIRKEQIAEKLIEFGLLPINYEII